jgi:hypothetical protein
VNEAPIEYERRSPPGINASISLFTPVQPRSEVRNGDRVERFFRLYRNSIAQPIEWIESS